MTTAYADDLTIFLRGFHGLAIVGPIMEDYHLAAGAATNWGKTEGLRLGSLRGALPGAAIHAPTRAGPTAMAMWGAAGQGIGPPRPQGSGGECGQSAPWL